MPSHRFLFTLVTMHFQMLCRQNFPSKLTINKQVGHGYELQIFGACIRAKHGRLSGLHLSGVSIVKEYTRQHLKPALLQVPVEHVIEKVVTREVPVEVCAFFVRVYGFLDVHSRT